MLTESSSAAPVSSMGVESADRRTLVPDWLTFAVFAFVSARLAVRASGPVMDPDTWWHLRLGEEFRGSWSLADPGQLSPFATRPWFATQWTLELVASYLNDWFGLAAVSWLAGLGVVALAVAVYVNCRQRGSIAAAAMAASVALVGTSMSHGPRPQMASFILAAIFTVAWLRSADDLKARWWLIPLTWLWACTHGMWFVGVLIGVLVVVGMLLDGRLDRREALRLGAVPVLGLVAAAVTPVGPKLLLAPFATSKMAQFVTEWQPPKFSEPVPALALLMVAIVVAAWARLGVRRSFVEVLLLAMAVGWIVLSYRTIALGVVIVAPLLAGVIQELLPANRLRPPRWEPVTLVALVLVTVVGLAIAAPSRERAPFDEMDRMNEALGRLPDGTVVFNEYALGGWLEWKHRNLAPVVDGMTDAYQVSYMSSYMKTVKLERGWRERIDRTGADYAFFPSDEPLAAALMDDGWKTLIREESASFDGGRTDYLLLQRGVGPRN